MKKVLITGKDSYIGNSFEKYIKGGTGKSCDAPETEAGFSGIEIEKTSLRGEAWKTQDWSRYDAVLHVAGIAHVDIGKADEETKRKYYRVNRDLAKEAAEKAKAEGVKQFIYLSSIIIYGDSAPIGKEKVITKDTTPAPANFYGDSKLQGEKAVLELQSERFRVLALRLPMVYGKDAKGNFQKLMKFAERIPVFPRVENQRSMIYIGNLCELIRIGIEKNLGGIICPQNRETVSTSAMVEMMGRINGKKIYLITGTTWILKLFGKMSGYVNKVFGNIIYDRSLSRIEDVGYQIYSLEESLRIGAGRKE